MLVEVQLAVNSMIDCKHYSFILYYYSQILSQDERGIANDEDVMIANDIVENTIAGAFQLDPPTQNRAIQAMNRHILAGNMLKARQAARGSAISCPCVRWENSDPPAWQILLLMMMIFQLTHPSILMLRRSVPSSLTFRVYTLKTLTR